MSPPEPAAEAPETPAPPRWRSGEVLVAIVVSFVLAGIAGQIVLRLAGIEPTAERSATDQASLALIAVLQAALWIGMVGAVVVLVVRRGGDLRHDLGLRLRPSDLPIGIVVGVAAQVVGVAVISWPWVRLLGAHPDDLTEPACRLAQKADDPLGVVLLVLITVVGAPIVEELFFRGLAQRAFVARLGVPGGLIVTALAFGLVHFQTLQAPALIAFGLLLGVMAQRTGRLGLGIVTHMAFNATTVVSLLLLQSSGSSTCDRVLGVLHLP